MGHRQRRRVALLIQTATHWSREVLRGVAAFAFERGGWDFWLEQRGANEETVLPPEWEGDGILCRLTSEKLARTIEKLAVPAINTSWRGVHTTRIPKVVSDERATGRMAAAYLVNKQFTSFAYCGPHPSLNYSAAVEEGFREALGEHGYNCHVFRYEVEPKSPAPANFATQRPAVTRWLHALPKPVALLVWSDEIGRQFAVESAEAGIDVPDDLAILAVEQDPLLSALSPLPLSSIKQDGYQVGYQAAALLEDMMCGAPAPEHPVLIPPIDILENISTDCMFTGDKLVQRAVNLIRANVNSPYSVSQLLNHLCVSRRSLEHAFRKALRRGPADEIRRCKLLRVKKLLIETDFSVARIASSVGFNHPEVLTRLFKREVGMTPQQYRKSAKHQGYYPEQ